MVEKPQNHANNIATLENGSNKGNEITAPRANENSNKGVFCHKSKIINILFGFLAAAVAAAASSLPY